MIRFNLAQLEAFYWVARLGGFRAAAKHLRLSQPTITQRVKSLEEAIETTLLDRSGYRPKLTSAGHSVLRHSQQTLDLAGRIQAFRKQSKTSNPLLRMGIVDFTAITDLPAILKLFDNEFLDLQLDLTIDYSARLQTLLVENRIDVAILTEPDLLQGIDSIPLGSIPLSWACSPEMSLPAGPLRQQDLIDFRIVTNPRPSNLHTTILEWFSRKGLVPANISTCNSMSGLRQLVSAGYAISVLPTDLLVTPNGPDNLRCLTTTQPLKPHRSCLAYRRDNDDPALQAILRPLGELLSRH